MIPFNPATVDTALVSETNLVNLFASLFELDVLQDIFLSDRAGLHVTGCSECKHCKTLFLTVRMCCINPRMRVISTKQR